MGRLHLGVIISSDSLTSINSEPEFLYAAGEESSVTYVSQRPEGGDEFTVGVVLTRAPNRPRSFATLYD